MDKSILIIISSFRWGGINVALQSLLKQIDPNEVKVDIFVMVHSGNYENKFDNCTILPKNYFVDALIDHARLKSGVTKLISGGMKILNKLTKDRFQHWVFKIVGNKLASQKKYDAVIGWHEGVPTTFVSHIDHPNKIAWVHCNYANYAEGPEELGHYSTFKSIVNVSEYTTRAFIDYYPSLKEKCHTIYNILDVDSIRLKAQSEIDGAFDDTGFTIISVGRVSPVKRFSQIPMIARRLVDLGCSFKWYILGPTYPGQEYDSLMENLERTGTKEVVIILGERQNPYPYIARANLVVSTSQSEALPYVVNEALSLGVPIVSTDYGSAYELLDERMIAAIDIIHEIIAPLILDCRKYMEVKENMTRWVYDNPANLQKFYSIL